MGVLNCVDNLVRLDEMGSSGPADERAVKDIMEGHPRIVQNVWQAKHRLASDSGPTASFVSRVCVSNYLIKVMQHTRIRYEYVN